MTGPNKEQLIKLADAAIEGRLNATELNELQQMVVRDPELAGLYADYVSMHATLWMTRGKPLEHRSGPRHTTSPAATEPRHTWSNARMLQWMIALAATLLLMLAAGWYAGRTVKSSIAVLAEVKGCKWGAGTLPTELGAELSKGRLRLAEGLARIVFNNGVEVRLESPADIEIISPMRCIMHAGKLVASVPPNAKGFVVETPSSVVTDFGTEFGVSVTADQSAMVQVFRGRVDTMHRHTGDVKVMHEGSLFLFNEETYGPCESAEQSPYGNASREAELSQGSWLHVTTAQGRGRDTYVQPTGTEDLHRGKNLLLVKRPFREHMEWERRVYLGFDLSAVDKRHVEAASLSLTFAPTGLGFASLVPDSRFLVYGLVDETQDRWTESELTWENAPGNALLPKPANESQLIHLGSFELPQGDQSSTISLDSPVLREFLNTDTNQLVTLIVVRETDGVGASDLVHGFASRRHPTLPPPTLRLKLEEPRRPNET